MEQLQPIIGKNTPISIALVLALCGGAYWTGSSMSTFNMKVESLRKTDESLKALTTEISILSSDNKRRLDIMEDREIREGR